jgi:hypothetical protein
VVFVLHSNRRLNLRSQVRSLVRGDGWPSMHPDGEEFFRDLGVPQIEVPPTGSLDDIPDGDVIIATWWRTAELVAALGPSKGAKVYFLQHYEIHPALPLERVKNTWRLPFHKVVVHRWLADVAAREYGDHFVSVVPNSVDTELFDSPPRGKQPVPTVGTMYSDARFKGSDIAFEAIRIARKSIPNLRVLSFGATKAFQRIDVPPGTEFHRNPPQARIRDIYSRCDAWLFASRSEGFGLPILEAMACRTPRHRHARRRRPRLPIPRVRMPRAPTRIPKPWRTPSSRWRPSPSGNGWPCRRRGISRCAATLGTMRRTSSNRRSTRRSTSRAVVKPPPSPDPQAPQRTKRA